ncbi:MAG: MBL fold metallo-hydrolase [Candidatus ainarchaeum sp.]|nr:MBL fold metallo-hydrolase [Candidatus ainarchaeum sp.]
MNKSIKLSFYGGVEEVGRSCYLIEKGDKNIVLDCGIKLGEKVEHPEIPKDKIKSIKEIIISHAHLDHSGYLPHLYSDGYSPKIIATKPTRDLMGVLLSDYRRIQKEPAFSQKDVDECMKRVYMTEYGSIKSQFEYTLFQAGHIIGSSMIRIEESGGILYTGDICMRNTRVLEGCKRGVNAENLIVESTYGSKEDILPGIKEEAGRMIELINKTLKEGGSVLIPSFAVGRAQEILLLLDDYMQSGALTKVPIYVDGMINKVMRIYRHNAIYANEDIKRKILMSDYDPFNSKNFKKPKTKDRSDVLQEPCIIVSTSGMLSGGPALYYLEKLAPDPKNMLLFVGYQAEGTRGKKILDGEKEIELGENKVKMNMKIESIKISGHADYREIVQFIHGVKGLKKVFIVHGESKDLGEELEKKYEVIFPKRGEEFVI